MAQQVKDLVLSSLGLGFDPWPWNFRMLGHGQKKKKKKRTHRKEATDIAEGENI